MARKKTSSLFVQTPEQEKKYTINVPSSLVERMETINEHLTQVDPRSVFPMEIFLAKEFERLVEQAESELNLGKKSEARQNLSA